MRFLTFNLWHGLSPSTPLAMDALEPVTRRQLREDLQLEVLSNVEAQIAFFQEVNPASSRAETISERLKMQFQFQPDLVGVKVLGVGLPVNLNSGLVTCADQQLGVRWVNALSLTHPQQRLVSAWASWQLEEERFALFAETLIPKWGRVLLINTHLHHGLECTPDVLARLEKLESDFGLSGATISELKSRVIRGNKRRESEMANLFGYLRKIESRYEAVVMAGDFNASPDSDLHSLIEAEGFRDAWSEANPNEDGFTFDGSKNVANHLLQGRFPSTLVVEDLSFSPKTKDELSGLARHQEAIPRRIDYVWFKSKSIPLQARSAKLIGLPDGDGMAPSDHFGMLTDIDLED